MPTHTSQTCTHTETNTDLEALQNWRTFWCLSKLQMPTSGATGFQIKRTRTRAISRAQKWWAPMWTLSSRQRVLISFILLLSVSVTQLPRGVKDHTFIISAGPPVRDTQKHTRTPEQHLCSLFSKEKKLGFWWLNAPVAPLSPSSWYHMSCYLFYGLFPVKGPLQSSLWLYYYISRDKYKGRGAWHL